MKPAILLVALVLLSAFSASSQTPDDKTANAATPAVKPVDPKLHADAIKLVEAIGAKEYLQENFEKLVEEGRKATMDKCPDCSPEFGKEWKKRFLEQSNIDDYLEVCVRAYEKYFTDAEITELIALKRDTSDNLIASPALKEKITAVMPELMGDVVGDCGKIGAKLGAKIGAEIQREHPEYVKTPTTSTKP